MDATVFIKTWSLVQLINCVNNHHNVVTFYQWWISSNMSEKHKTGLSTYGYPLLGFIRIPQLRHRWYVLVCILYYVSLGLIICWPQKLTLLISFVLAVFYYGCNWAEASMSYHREMLVIALYMYFLLATNFEIAAFCLRVHISSIYVGSVLQKIIYSVIERKLWFRWSMHGFMWKSMWSKPNNLQKILFVRPNVCALLALCSMFIEASVPLSLFYPQYNWLIFLNIICFHYGVYLLQDINYLTYWAPVLLVLITSSSATAAFTDIDMTDLAVIMLSFQLFYCFSMMENWNINIPPFMSCPMFVTIARLDDKYPQHYTISGQGKSPIKYERLEWMYPFMKLETGIGGNMNDIFALPFPTITFGIYNKLQDVGLSGTILNYAQQHIKSNFPTGVYMYTNIVIPAHTQKKSMI